MSKLPTIFHVAIDSVTKDLYMVSGTKYGIAFQSGAHGMLKLFGYRRTTHAVKAVEVKWDTK